MAAPRRRRFRFAFSLRTLFVLLTVVCIGATWVGWQANIVRHRQSWLPQLRAGEGVAVFDWDVDWMDSQLTVKVRPADRSYQISALRGLLGDLPVELIGFPRQLTPSDREAIAAFPEAEIYAIP